MKKRFGFVLVFVLLSSLLLSPAVQAAHTDAFTFFIPWPASVPSPAGELNDLAEFFAAGNQISAGGRVFSMNSIEYTVSISVLRDGGLIYYDHWEDGLEPNPNFPVQDSTEIWGDGNPGNGIPPGYPADALQSDRVITLKNEVPIPYNPSPGQATYPFDGGDKVMAVDSALAVSMAAWPMPYATAGGIRFADAFELYPTSRWGKDYVIPIGENVARLGDGFAIVAFNVLSSEDGNPVEIDPEGDGTFVPIPVNGGVLDEGDSYMVVGGVNAGAGVRALEPVQVQVFAKNPNSD